MAAEEKKLVCPGCANTLEEAWAEANYGRVLLLDQCASCGGVWFDRWELYFAKAASIKSLNTVDMKAFLGSVPLRIGSNECPRCLILLVPFTDPSLPVDATIKRCPQCSGVWLNRRDLLKYASHKERFKPPTPAGPAPELKALKSLQKELNTSKIGIPTTLELASALDDAPPIETKEVVKDMGFLILQALLRLVFKF
jgi:Zn-finger nucleic acid-binding protein